LIPMDLRLHAPSMSLKTAKPVEPFSKIIPQVAPHVDLAAREVMVLHHGARRSMSMHIIRTYTYRTSRTPYIHLVQQTITSGDTSAGAYWNYACSMQRCSSRWGLINAIRKPCQSY
jgi:hypothetical protein